jgi:hypothetical protein
VDLCSFAVKSEKNILFKLLGPSASSAEVIPFRVMHYIRVRNYFLQNMWFLGIKIRRILHRFKKYKLFLDANVSHGAL